MLLLSVAAAAAQSQSPAAVTATPAAVAADDQHHDADDGDDADDKSGAEARQQVLQLVVDEFLQLVDVDRRTAVQYVTSYQMNLDAALGAYFDDQPPT